MSVLPALERELVDAHRRTRGRTSPTRSRAIAVVIALFFSSTAVAAASYVLLSSADPEIAGQLSVLTRPVAAQDRVNPEVVQRGLRSSFATEETRLVHGAPAGWKAWVAPSRAEGSACLLVQPPLTRGPGAGACFSRRHLQTDMPGPTRVEDWVVGLVRDGVVAVTIRQHGRPVTRARVTDNAYFAHVPDLSPLEANAITAG